MSKPFSKETNINVYWYFDERNPKMLINLPKLFGSYLDVDSSKMFSEYKRKIVNTYIERGYYPNTLMGDIANAEEDYNVLKDMFKLA